MISTLRSKFQITIPSKIISTLGLKEGDQLDIYEYNGVIHMLPVTVCPRSYVHDLQEEFDRLKAASENGSAPNFDSMDAILEKIKTSANIK